MKTKLFFISMFWISMLCFSQNTNVPDDNFENYLETHDAAGNTVTLGDSSSMGNGIANDDTVLTANINTVTSLNVSSMNISDLTGIQDFTALTYLNCSYNNLNSLDVSQNTALTELDCSYNNISILDISQNNALTFLVCETNSLSILDTSQNNLLTILVCSSNDLNNLDISQNTALTELWCSSNNLSILDTSQNNALTYLYCSLNDLNNLDISQNTALTELICNSNNLSILDTSQNTALTLLDCSSNNLSSLNVKNGNNLNFYWFKATTNPNLECIDVDDAAWSTVNWTYIDAQTSFSQDCVSETYVPDDNFETALINLGYDTLPLDDYVPTANINTVTSLNVSSMNISDLTGIEGFTALTSLICGSNNLSTLDVSQNNVLTTLVCDINNLSSLDVSQNTALTSLNCSDNNLNTLDVSQNVSLTLLGCVNTNLSTLDVSQNITLTDLYCAYNNLSTLDVSQNTFLITLNCSNNNLSSLNVKNGNNTNFTLFAAQSNPNLNCIEVDDEVWSTANWTNIDPQTSFSEDCSTMSVDDFLISGFKMYPNPVNALLTIRLHEDANYTILNVNGQVFKTGKITNTENTIDVSNLSSGLYFIKVNTNKGTLTKKLIKQ